MVSENIFIAFTAVMLISMYTMLSSESIVHKTFFALATIMTSAIGSKWCSSGSVVSIVSGVNATAGDTMVTDVITIQTTELAHFYMFVLMFSVIYIVIFVVNVLLNTYQTQTGRHER